MRINGMAALIGTVKEQAAQIQKVSAQLAPRESSRRDAKRHRWIKPGGRHERERVSQSVLGGLEVSKFPQSESEVLDLHRKRFRNND